MTVHSVLQGSRPAAPPAIPAIPSSPGAATGAQGGPATISLPTVARDAATAARDAAIADRDAANGARDAIIAGRVPGPDAPAQSGTSLPSIPFDPNNLIPPEVIPLTGMTLAMIVVIFVGWPIARAFARRMDRRTELGTVKAAELQPQLRQLQESVDAMAVELERIGEAQRLTAKLMAERAPALPATEARRA